MIELKLDKMRPYYILQIILGITAGLIIPYKVIFLRTRGIDLLQIGILASAFEVAIFLFEIPTGYLADWKGRKISVLAGLITISISGLIYSISYDFSYFLVAEIIFGLGETFISGAGEAWTVDNMLVEGYSQKDITIMLTEGERYLLYSMILGMVLGSIIQLKTIKLLWVFYFAIYILGSIILGLFTKEEKIESSTGKNKESSNGKIIIDFFRNPILVLLFLITILGELSFSAIDEYWQVFFKEDLLINVDYFGLITISSTLICAISIRRITNYLDEKFNTITVLAILRTGMIISILLLAYTLNPYSAVAIYIVITILRRTGKPFIKGFLNSLIESGNRATIISTVNLAGSIGEIFAGIFMGIIVTELNIRWAFIISAGFMFFILLVYISPALRNDNVVKTRNIN